MKILLAALPLGGLMTGISRYVRNLYVALEKITGVQVSYFDGRRVFKTMPEQADPARWIKSTDQVWKRPDAVVTALRAVYWYYYEYQLNSRLKEQKYHVFHETAFTPAAVRGRTPQVFTLHDLSLMEHTEHHPRERVWTFNLFFKRRIACADHIITVSEFIKREMCEKLGIREDKITAIHEACDPYFFPRSEIQIKDTRAELGLPKNYILFVGTLEPRKNLSLIIRALSHLPDDINLVLTGWSGWGSKDWLDEVQALGIRHRVFVPGYVREDQLAALYSGALAFVYPSFYEGFGLPLLEAFSCGCPVICSDRASLPEVAGDAAILIDPHDHEQLADAVLNVAENPDERDHLIEKGKQRARIFSWEKCAIETLDVFRKSC